MPSVNALGSSILRRTRPRTEKYWTACRWRALDGLGQLALADTVFVASEGERTLGIVFASDEAGTACLITLDLTDEGCGHWQATMLGTARGSASAGESHTGSGQEFGFATRMFAAGTQDAA